MIQTTTDPYASRVTREEIVPRADPVVWQGVPGPLPPPEVDAYARTGFRAVSGLFGPDDVRAMAEESRRLAEAADRSRADVITEPGSDAVRSLFRLHRTSDVFRAVCRDPRLVDVVRQLLGSEVYVHQSRINFKPGFRGREFYWHSDFETWHVEDGMPRMRAISVSIALTENTEFNGPLIVMPGSHERYVRCAGESPEEHYRQSLKKQEYGVPSPEALTKLAEQGGLVAPKGPAGSATFFECNLMHGSVGNLSPWPRSNFFVVFNSVENGLVAPFGGRAPRPEFLGERAMVPVAEL